MSSMPTPSSAPEASSLLPVGYRMRAPTLDDVNVIAELLRACDIHDYGEARETEATIRDHWQPMSLESDVRVVLTSGGRVVGYADQPNRNAVRLPGYACVHPAHRERSIGSALTSWIEAQADQRIQNAPEGARVSLQFAAASKNGAAAELLKDRGYEFERGFQRMVIGLAEPLEQPEWPAGVEVRQYVRGPDDRPTWQSVEEAFDDHWGNVRKSFEEWSHIYDRESFDASLWFLAVEGDEIAGASLCSNRDDMGWVGSLSVRRPWRKRGLAVSLLHHSFAEFYRRGQRKVGLGVDSSSLTGATRVYERAGMRADQHTILYAKILRDGEEIATQELEE